ncbi:MAG: VC1465 family Xer recombination activation factor [Rhodoferax sp.]|nr:VC1465 family Xer recombination activation factor [Rhodoferax sp.]MDO8450015.1 VC1465 family Xer recombination activation factor [Rhodoferax sp.]
MLSDAGLTPEAAAQLLHVTPRTIRYWISGTVTVPYAAYKLVRVMRLFELPCKGWEGWHMHSGKLWTPEGHGFTPECQGWWSLLVRQARLFRDMAQRERQLDIAMQRTLNGPLRTAQAGPSAKAEPDAGRVASDVLIAAANVPLTPPYSNTGGKVPKLERPSVVVAVERGTP